MRGNKSSKSDLKMNAHRKGERGRPKKRWLDTIENDIKALGA
jgi:hypothetical protein